MASGQGADIRSFFCKAQSGAKGTKDASEKTKMSTVVCTDGEQNPASESAGTAMDVDKAIVGKGSSAGRRKASSGEGSGKVQENGPGSVVMAPGTAEANAEAAVEDDRDLMRRTIAEYTVARVSAKGHEIDAVTIVLCDVLLRSVPRVERTAWTRPFFTSKM